MQEVCSKGPRAGVQSPRDLISVVLWTSTLQITGVQAEHWCLDLHGWATLWCFSELRQVSFFSGVVRGVRCRAQVTRLLYATGLFLPDGSWLVFRRGDQTSRLLSAGFGVCVQGPDGIFQLPSTNTKPQHPPLLLSEILFARQPLTGWPFLKHILALA